MYDLVVAYQIIAIFIKYSNYKFEQNHQLWENILGASTATENSTAVKIVLPADDTMCRPTRHQKFFFWVQNIYPQRYAELCMLQQTQMHCRYLNGYNKCNGRVCKFNTCGTRATLPHARIVPCSTSADCCRAGPMAESFLMRNRYPNNVIPKLTNTVNAVGHPQPLRTAVAKQR